MIHQNIGAASIFMPKIQGAGGADGKGSFSRLRLQADAPQDLQ